MKLLEIKAAAICFRAPPWIYRSWADVFPRVRKPGESIGYVARSAKPGETCRVARETHPPWKQTRVNRTPWIPEIFERRIAVRFVIGIFRSIFRARWVTRNYSWTIFGTSSLDVKVSMQKCRSRLVCRVTNACGQATRTACRTLLGR